jgi:hypothetical protein
MGSLTEGFTGGVKARRGWRRRERNGGGGAWCRARGSAEKRSLMAQSIAGQMAKA